MDGDDEDQAVVKAIADLRKAEGRLEEVCRLIGSAKINIETALAVRHLQTHRPDALGMNASPNLVSALILAVEDLDRAVDKADLIPF